MKNGAAADATARLWTLVAMATSAPSDAGHGAEPTTTPTPQQTTTREHGGDSGLASRSSDNALQNWWSRFGMESNDELAVYECGGTYCATVHVARVFLGRELRRAERELVALAVGLAERRLELAIAEMDDMQSEVDAWGASNEPPSPGVDSARRRERDRDSTSVATPSSVRNAGVLRRASLRPVARSLLGRQDRARLRYLSSVRCART
jgi:hypothetical protein